MPGRSQETGRFLEGRLSSEIGRIVGGDFWIRVDPLGMVATKVAAVELVVAVHPTAQDRHFPFCENPGMVVLGVLRVRRFGQQGYEGALGRAQASGRQIRAVVVAPVSLEKRCEFGNDGTGQLLSRDLLIRGAVVLGDFAGQPQSTGRIRRPVA